MTTPPRQTRRQSSFRVCVTGRVASTLSTYVALHTAGAGAFVLPPSTCIAVWRTATPLSTPPTSHPRCDPCNHCRAKCTTMTRCRLSGEGGARNRRRRALTCLRMGSDSPDVEEGLEALRRLKVADLKERYKAVGGKPGTLRKEELISKLLSSLPEKDLDELGHSTPRRNGELISESASGRTVFVLEEARLQEGVVHGKRQGSEEPFAEPSLGAEEEAADTEQMSFTGPAAAEVDRSWAASGEGGGGGAGAGGAVSSLHGGTLGSLASFGEDELALVGSEGEVIPGVGVRGAKESNWGLREVPDFAEAVKAPVTARAQRRVA
ncbi:unnamed protein product, partial [Discosporangium mesarthrocarpum]